MATHSESVSVPAVPADLQATGLSADQVEQLLVKTLYVGEASGLSIADRNVFDLSTGAARVEILEQLKGQKIYVYKYKPKKNHSKKTGHRQAQTRIKVLEVLGNGS